MDNASILEKKCQELSERFPCRTTEVLKELLASYQQAIGICFKEQIPTWLLFCELVGEQLETPYRFDLYHRKVREPIDYYRFGLNFLLPLIDLPQSKVLGLENVDKMAVQLTQGANVILFANHQTEPDPQAISILLERTHPELAEKIIYVAGARVISDPLAVPFSIGCDLLCVYSKRYIDHPPEMKGQKQLHNKQTMERMSRLLQEGGKIIYVAPSGGRDRKNGEGRIEVDKFDPDSVEMFYLMSRKAKTTTYFYPLAVSTYSLFPPPETIQKELGETRSTQRTPIHLYFGAPFDMEHFTGAEESDRLIRRKMRAEALWSLVNHHYQILERLSTTPP